MTSGIDITLSALAVLFAFLIVQAVPAARAIRSRNALLLEPGCAGDFTWMPPRFPAGFRTEHTLPTREFLEIVESLNIGKSLGDWDKALALASHLTEHAEDKGPVRADPMTTYRAIRAGHGYCADFVKVFLVLAHAAGLVARQWAFSFDGFGGHGHTVVEVFDPQRGRWLLLDVYNNFHVVDVAGGEPLGVLEYRDALLGRRGSTAIRINGRGRPGFVHEHKALEYYRRGVHQWYLLWGNAALSYYANPAVRAAARVSPTLSAIVANVVGAQPRIRIYETPENAAEVRKMFALRRRLRWTIVGIAGLTVLFGAQLFAAQFGQMTG